MKKIQISHIGIIFLLNLLLKGVLIEGILIRSIILNCGYITSLVVTIIIFSLYGILSIKYYDFIGGDVLRINEKGKFIINNDEKFSINNLWIIIQKWFSGLLLCTQNTGLHIVFHRDKEKSYKFSRGIKIIFLLDIILVSIYINTFIYLGINIYDHIFK